MFVLCAPIAARAQEKEKTETFTVVGTRGDVRAVASAKLSVLKYDSGVRGLRAVSGIDAAFDAQGHCEVQLGPGQYVFEVLSDHDPDRIVALRTSPLTLNRGRKIDLVANQAVPLDVIAGRETVTLETVTIRSAALEGALVWNARNGKPPTLILSPTQNYRIGVLGHRDANRYAYWLNVRPEHITRLSLPVDQSLSATFAWRPASTARDESGQAFVALTFPDTVWRFEVLPDTELLTNRRYVEMAYSYPTPRGGRLAFHFQGYLLGKDTQLEIGGPVTPHAYVGVHRNYHDEKYDSRLAYEFWLADPGGQQVDFGASKIKFTKKLVRVDGQDLPPDPLTAGSLDNLRPLPDHFRVEAGYELDGPQQVALVPVEPVEMKSRHFVLQGVPGWEWRSRMYLLRAERAYDILGPISTYPASSHVNIGWLTNDHRARGGWKGKRNGAKRGFINMPFLRYRHCFDAFTHTNFLTHEVAHTYGYPHGEAMQAVQREGERRYREHRWFAADHPDYVPGEPW
jgi:hypothetical protein